MMAAASELGFDGEDFETLDQDLNESKCNVAGSCSINTKKIKSWDKMFNDATIVKNVANRLKCHPYIKDKDVPRVEFIWNVWPFYLVFNFCPTKWTDFLLLSCNPITPILWCFCIPFTIIMIPFYAWITLFLAPICYMCSPVWMLVTFFTYVFCPSLL